MADRRCPFCGELVPSTSITCPKCYKKIPQEPEPVRKQERDGQKDGGGRTRSRKVALLLALIPGLFGFLGLGLIYKDHKQKIGYLALVFGLLFFWAAVLFTMPLFTLFLAVPCWIIYVIMYLVCAGLTVMDGLFFRMV